eukprot:s1650_g2.t1
MYGLVIAGYIPCITLVSCHKRYREQKIRAQANTAQASASDSGTDVQVKSPVQTASKSAPKDKKAVDFKLGELQQEKLRLSSEVERLRRKLNRLEAVDPHAAALAAEWPNPRSLRTSLEA